MIIFLSLIFPGYWFQNLFEMSGFSGHFMQVETESQKPQTGYLKKIFLIHLKYLFEKQILI
jgi:hypothetical protein